VVEGRVGGYSGRGLGFGVGGLRVRGLGLWSWRLEVVVWAN